MIRDFVELGFIACVVTGFYLAWAPLGFIFAGLLGLLWLALNGDK